MQHQEASEKRPKAAEKMFVSGRNVRHPPENIQIPPAKPRKWMQHQEASEKRPKAAEKMLASGRNVRHPPENIQSPSRKAKKLDVTTGSLQKTSKSRRENACK